jgi:hypothetical protein
MESFRRNLSEIFSAKLESFGNIFCKTGIFQNGIFQKEFLRKYFHKTGIFQNGIFQKESFRRNLSENMFEQNWNLSECNLSKGIFPKKNLSETTI